MTHLSLHFKASRLNSLGRVMILPRGGDREWGWFLSFPPRYDDGICSSKPWMISHFQKSMCEPFPYLTTSLESDGSVFNRQRCHNTSFQARCHLLCRKNTAKSEHWLLLERGIGSLGGKEMYCSLYILLYFLNFEPLAYTIHSKQELNDKTLSGEKQGVKPPES